MGLVISLCDRTGNMVKPWLAAGHKCILVDLEHPPGVTQEGNLVKIGGRVEEVAEKLDVKQNVNFIVFAFPPCTHVAVSGSSRFQTKGLGKLIEALTTLHACVKVCERAKAYCLENPVSVFSSYWRKPNYTYNPWQYCDQSDDPAAEIYAKRTCLWTSENFIMPRPTNIFSGDNKFIMNAKGDRGTTRSVTPTGFARAVFEANKHLL